MKKVFLFLAGALLMAGCNQDELLTTQDQNQKQPFSDQVISVEAPAILFDGDGSSELRLAFNAGKLKFELKDAIGFFKYDGADMGLTTPWANRIYQFEYDTNKFQIDGDSELFRNVSGKDFKDGTYAAFHPFSSFVNIAAGPPNLMRLRVAHEQRQEVSNTFSHLNENGAIFFSSVNEFEDYTAGAIAHVIGVPNTDIRFAQATSYLYFNLPGSIFEGGADEQLLQIKVNAEKAGVSVNLFPQFVYGHQNVIMNDYWDDMNDIDISDQAAFQAQHSQVIGYSGGYTDEVVLRIGKAGEMGVKAEDGFVAIIAVAINPTTDYTNLALNLTLRTTSGIYTQEYTTFGSSGWIVPGYAYQIPSGWSPLQEIKWTEGCSEPVDEVDDVYSIYSPCELAWIAEQVNGSVDFAGKTIKLMNNLDLGGETDQNWTPIGTDAARFRGTFDGQGNTIKNLYVDLPGGNAGLFGYNTGEIKNLTINGVEIVSGNYVGSIAGVNIGTISDCDVNGININGTYVGGIAGVFTRGTSTKPPVLEGCTVTGDANNVTGTLHVGGIAGYVYGANILVNDNKASANVTCNSSNAGGIVGKTAVITNSIVSCYFSGEVKGANAGGIVGDNAGTVVSSYFSGAVKGANAGGVVGDNAGTIEQCAIGAMGASVDETTIIATTNGGGIVGINSGTVVACANPGADITSSTNAGGVAGSNAGLIAVCYYGADGNTLQATISGGIAGENSGNIQSVVTNITNSSVAGICQNNTGIIGNSVTRGGAPGNYNTLLALGTDQTAIAEFLEALNGGTASKFRRSVIEPELMYVWAFDGTNKKFNMQRTDYEEIIVAAPDFVTNDGAYGTKNVWITDLSRYPTATWGATSGVLKATVTDDGKLSTRPLTVNSVNFVNHNINKANWQGRYYEFENTDNTAKWEFSAELEVTQDMIDGTDPFCVSFWGECQNAPLLGGAYPILAASNVIENGVEYPSGYLPEVVGEPQWKCYNSNDTGTGAASWSGNTPLTLGWNKLTVKINNRTITYLAGPVAGTQEVIGSFDVESGHSIILEKFMFYIFNFNEVDTDGSFTGYDLSPYSFGASFRNASVTLK